MFFNYSCFAFCYGRPNDNRSKYGGTQSVCFLFLLRYFIGNIFSCFLWFVLARRSKMKKMTQKEVEERMIIYDEIVDHLNHNICETKGEEKQAKIVKKQIEKIMYRFYARYKL